jgi:hypothetical protein
VYLREAFPSRCGAGRDVGLSAATRWLAIKMVGGFAQCIRRYATGCLAVRRGFSWAQLRRCVSSLPSHAHVALERRPRAMAHIARKTACRWQRRRTEMRLFTPRWPPQHAQRRRKSWPACSCRRAHNIRRSPFGVRDANVQSGPPGRPGMRFRTRVRHPSRSRPLSCCRTRDVIVSQLAASNLVGASASRNSPSFALIFDHDRQSGT